MKRNSPNLLQVVVASANMSSCPPRRGGNYHSRRGYCDRKSGNCDPYVAGDSHLQSVRNADRGYGVTHFEKGRLSNDNSYQSRLRHQAPPFIPSHTFNPYPPQFHRPHPPPFNQQEQFRRPPPLPHEQQVRRPRLKPLDYREWEFAKPGPPLDGERFTVLSYNILADYLAIKHRNKLYFHIPRHILDWEWRKRSILFELGLWSADVLCFQEVDRFLDLEEELKIRGYKGIWKMRTGSAIDGCATFWHVSRFKLLHEEYIEFSKLGLRDNVVQICVLEVTAKPHNQNVPTLPMSSTGSNRVVICNIHVLYNPRRGEIKLGQIRVLLDRAHAVSKLWDDAPVVLCGDFNLTPKSPLYNFIVEQKLDLSSLPRDRMSGQASAEIHAPRPFYSNTEAQQSYKSVKEPANIDEKISGQGVSPLDEQSQDVAGNNLIGVLDLSTTCKTQHRDVELKKSTSFTTIQEIKDSISSGGSNENHVDIFKGSKDEPASRGSFSYLNTCPFSENHEKDGFSENTAVEFHHEDKSNSYKGEVAISIPFGSSVERPNASYNRVCPGDKLEGKLCVTTPVEHHCESNASNKTLLEAEICTSVSTALSDLYNKSANCKEGELFSLANTSFVDPMTHYGSVCNSEDQLPPYANDMSFPESLTTKVVLAKEDGNLGEDCDAFLSALHNLGGSQSGSMEFQGSMFEEPVNLPNNILALTTEQFHSLSTEHPEDSPNMIFEAVDDGSSTYDPSAWTPVEIETATGNAGCTMIEHHLKLSSSYAEVEDISGTRDANGEPLVTSYNRCFSGTVDYIWHSNGLQTVKVLAPIPKQAMQWTCGFPTKKWGSDHIALVSELIFTKDDTIQNAEAHSCHGLLFGVGAVAADCQ